MKSDSLFLDTVQTTHSVSPQPTAQPSKDDDSLARLGKKPVLRRNFGFLTILGFSTIVLITWEAAVTVFLAGLQNGGPAGIIYGFIVVWAGTLSVFITLAELVSMAPTSGGQYHWVSMLAPPSYRKFFGYITGWLTLTGWQALVASGGYVTGSLIQGLIILNHPDYILTIQRWHTTLLAWAIILSAYLINNAIGSVLARFEGVLLFLHVIGFFGVLFPIAFLGSHASVSDVFETFINQGGWQTQGLSFSVGIVANVFAFVGGDGAIHMSEEIRNAATVVPWSIIIGLMINGTLGFGMVIATLFSLNNDIDAALAANPLYPFMAIFQTAVQSTAAATVMSAVVVVLSFSATAGILASTSRVYWALSRDRALPGWTVLRRVHARTSIPTYSVLATTVIGIILTIINIGNTLAFNGVISITIASLFGSYLVTASLLLWRRLRGNILTPRQDGSDDTLTNTIGSKLTWGPWRLPRVAGIVNNIFACVYLIYILFFSFWPATKDVTPQNMNYAVVAFGAVAILSIIYYLVWARKTYTGPIIETNARHQ